MHHLLCYQVNYIVCHYETFNVALKLAAKYNLKNGLHFKAGVRRGEWEGTKIYVPPEVPSKL